MDGEIPLGVATPAGEPELEVAEHSEEARNSFGLASWKKVFWHAYSLVGNEAEAEDLAQDTFVELFRAQSRGKSVLSVGGWMQTVTKRLAYRRYRQQRPDLHTSVDIMTEEGEHTSLELADTRPSPEEKAVDDAMVRLSAKVLSEFSARERECVLMYFRGYDYVRIAAALGISRWTARRLTLEAANKIRARLESPRKR